jgi:hypothetical protein
MLMPDDPVVLQPLLEPPQLLFHFFDGAVEGCKNSIGLFNRDKFIVMLGPHPQLERWPLAMFQIDCHGDCGHPVKESSNAFHLFSDFLLGRRAEMTVTGCYRRLHRWGSRILAARFEPTNRGSNANGLS